MSSVGVGLRQPLPGERGHGGAGEKEDAGAKKARHVEALVQRAVFEFKRGELVRARMLGKYLMEAEGAPEGIKIVALCAHQQGDEDVAWELYPQALLAFSRDLNVIVGFAELCLNRHAFDRAAELLEKALTLDPEARHPAGAKARILILRAKPA